MFVLEAPRGRRRRSMHVDAVDHCGYACEFSSAKDAAPSAVFARTGILAVTGDAQDNTLTVAGCRWQSESAALPFGSWAVPQRRQLSTSQSLDCGNDTLAHNETSSSLPKPNFVAGMYNS